MNQERLTRQWMRYGCYRSLASTCRPVPAVSHNHAAARCVAETIPSWLVKGAKIEGNNWRARIVAVDLRTETVTLKDREGVTVHDALDLAAISSPEDTDDG